MPNPDNPLVPSATTPEVKEIVAVALLKSEERFRQVVEWRPTPWS